MMVPVALVVLFAIGAAFIAAAIGHAAYRRSRGSMRPTNRLSNRLATAGGLIAGSAILWGFAYQGSFT